MHSVQTNELDLNLGSVGSKIFGIVTVRSIKTEAKNNPAEYFGMLISLSNYTDCHVFFI